MKTSNHIPQFVRPALVLLAMTGLAAHAAAGEDSAPKTHTLFMGTDIELQQAKDFYRVENVEGGSFVIKVDGKDKKIPTETSVVPMKVSHHLKLAENSITVEKLAVERAYTMANDPNTKFVASLGASAAGAQLSATSHEMAKTLIALREVPPGGRSAGVGAGPYAVDLAAQAAEAQKNYDLAASMMNSDMNSAAYSAGVLSRELAEEMYDAVEITFQVSSSRPMNSPYAVVIAQFSAPGAKPSEVQSWVYATELDPITSETRKVKILQGGFPRGFTLKSHSLHLYNRGQEVATTVAPKRVELTREEAFDYIVISYVADNKGKTLPATLVMGRLPEDVGKSGKWPAVYVEVTKEGLPAAAFADEACAHKLDDPALDAALRTLRFKPALKEGKAIAGLARLSTS